MINNVLNKLSNVKSSFGCFQYIPVRHRYWADKIAKGRVIKNFGYKDSLFKGGPLPRLENATKLPMPDYRPGNAWSRERALFGQNDYIDILGDGKLHPVTVSYNVPFWLRGVKGKEMQLWLAKAKAFAQGPYPEDYPKAWNNINKRIRYLYKFLNTRTRTTMTKQ